VFADAFVGDAMITWPLAGASPNDVAAMFSIVIDEAYGPMDVVWVAGLDGAERVDGAAVWLAPADAARFGEIDAATRSRIAALTEDGGARYASFWDWIDGYLPDEPCWFLDILAVRDAVRGRGLASALVGHGLDQARAAGVPAVLETGNPANVPMYEHLGFRVVERSEAPGGGPTIWFLRADPD
jgi:GNAT superfamily N-acetyltransferase